MPINTAAVKHLGIDDFAFKRRERYGTLLVNLDTGKPVDVLPDRDASTVAKWLKQHPEIEVVTRHRWGDYARGVATGAPQAQQVLDRWNLVKNLREALERQLGRYREVIQTVKSPTGDHLALPLHSTAMERSSVEALERQRTRYQELFQAYQEGQSLNRIVKEFGVHRATVQRAIRQKGSVTRRRHARPAGVLTPFEALLREKWATCQNASQLYRDLVAAGFTGTKRSVCRWAQERRVVPAPTTPGPYRESAIRNHTSGEQARPKAGLRVAEASWLLFSFTEELDDVQQTLLRQLLQFPPLQQARNIVIEFRTMVRNRCGASWSEWLQNVTQSGLQDLVNFSRGLANEGTAVTNALSLPFSNGTTEGAVGKLKAIKRQMFGRGNLDLLRLRVLYA